MGHKDPQTDESIGYSRRQALKAAAAGSIGFIAGCSGDGDTGATPTSAPTESPTLTEIETVQQENTQTETATSDSMEFVDTTFRYGWARDQPLTDTELNIWNAQSQMELVWPMMARMGGLSLATGEWVNADIAGWTVDTDNDELRITIKDDVYWTQGGEVIDPVTGADWALKDELDRRMTPRESRSDNPTVVGWRESDDDPKVYIRELNPEGYNDQRITGGFWRTPIPTYRNDWYADKLEALKDASTASERDSIRSEVTGRSVTLSDDPPLSGPYMLTDVNNQQATFERTPGHWSERAVNWRNFRLVKLSPSGNADYQAMASDRIDLGGDPPDAVQDMPNFLQFIMGRTGSNFGMNLAINYGGPVPSYLGKGDSDAVGQTQALVRQAIGYAVNLNDVVANNFGSRAGEFLDPYQRQHPGGGAKVQNHFPDLYEQLPSFVEQRPDKAEDNLSRAGFSKESGTWVDSDGNPLRIELQSYPWSREGFETIKEDLDQIGFESEHVVTEASVLSQQFNEGTFFTGQAYPFHTQPLSTRVEPWLVGGWPVMNPPSRFRIPPIGEYEAEPTRTVEPAQLAEPFATTPLSEHRENLRTLIWTFSYHCPAIQLSPWPNPLTINKSHFEWPTPKPEGEFSGAGEEHAPIYTVTQPWRLLRRGKPGQIAKE